MSIVQATCYDGQQKELNSHIKRLADALKAQRNADAELLRLATDDYIANPTSPVYQSGIGYRTSRYQISFDAWHGAWRYWCHLAKKNSVCEMPRELRRQRPGGPARRLLWRTERYIHKPTPFEREQLKAAQLVCLHVYQQGNKQDDEDTA